MSSTAFPSALRLHLVPVPAPPPRAREAAPGVPPAVAAGRAPAVGAPPAGRAEPGSTAGGTVAARIATPEALRPHLLPAFPFSGPVVGGPGPHAGR